MNLTKKLKSNSKAGDRTVNRETLFVCLLVCLFLFIYFFICRGKQIRGKCKPGDARGIECNW